jgi:hypothetical protein
MISRPTIAFTCNGRWSDADAWTRITTYCRAIEANRSEIARTDRSALDPDAQPYQDLINQLLYGLAGLAAEEVRGLKERYARMR